MGWGAPPLHGSVSLLIQFHLKSLESCPRSNLLYHCLKELLISLDCGVPCVFFPIDPLFSVLLYALQMHIVGWGVILYILGMG